MSRHGFYDLRAQINHWLIDPDSAERDRIVKNALAWMSCHRIKHDRWAAELARMFQDTKVGSIDTLYEVLAFTSAICRNVALYGFMNTREWWLTERNIILVKALHRMELGAAYINGMECSKCLLRMYEDGLI